MQTLDDLMTTGQLARHFGVTPRRIEYAIGQADVQPTRRLGITRLFDAEAVAEIEAELRRIAERRSPQPA